MYRDPWLLLLVLRNRYEDVPFNELTQRKSSLNRDFKYLQRAQPHSSMSAGVFQKRQEVPDAPGGCSRS